MAHQVIWTKIIIETFIAEANLSKEEEMIIRTRAAGWPVSRQAMELNMSEATVHRMIKRLKHKYDEVQKHNVILPPRKKSAKELYMDTH
ncbi:MAG: hypothetical protein MJZ03_05605 [archaeon]|nr:hypothetical protein [archaeon]